MKDWFDGYRGCWCPPLCVGDYLSFPKRAAAYCQPISSSELEQQLRQIREGAIPVLKAPPPEGLREALLQALNIKFLIDGLDSCPLTVAVIREKSVGAGSAQYRERELLLADPFVGTLKGILLMPPEAGPFPAVLALHGHAETAELYRDSYCGSEYPRNGMALLMITLRVMQPWIMEHHVTKTLLLSGFNLIGLRVYEALIALKYLASQPEARPGGLGLIGRSGGSSTGNLLVRIAPERIRAFVSDYKVDYCAIPSFEPYHCETAPRVYPYHALINDFSTLPMACMEAPYGYGSAIPAVVKFLRDSLT